MNGLKVIKKGVMSTLQDLGRTGYMSLGVTQGGVMDEHAARWANRLLANSSNAALVEITLGNCEFEVQEPTVVAITGADVPLFINQQPVAHWRTHAVNVGDCISIGWCRNGLRVYLAVQGGFCVETEFGSMSTVIREGLGGLSGQPLVDGDVLPYEAQSNVIKCISQATPQHFVPDYDAPLVLRVIQGYQAEDFSEDALCKFYATQYQVANESDRMGYRLSGGDINNPPQGMLSEGIAYGAIQIPPDGQPIVLLKDRQTLGGYPKLGSVIPLDCFRLSQRRPTQTVRFEKMDIMEAQTLMKRFYQFFA